MNIFTDIFSPYVQTTPAMVLPLAVGLLVVLFVVYYIVVLPPKRCTTQWIDDEVEKGKLTFLNKRFKMGKRDIIPLTLITLIFLTLAIYNLGDTGHVDVLNEVQLRYEEEAETGQIAQRPHMTNIIIVDETIFVRTAVEHIENLNPREFSHPPVGKLILSTSVLTAGESPFGWRLFGAISGVLLLVAMYIFLKNMFGKTIIATCGTLLLGFDFMRFVLTRIGTVDSFLITFILLAFFFMYRHISTDRDAPFRNSLLPLALSGLFFGLSFSVKWIGFYAGAGLLIIYVIRLCQLGLYYKSSKKSGFGKYLIKTLLFSALFFVVIPAIGYYLSYIPYGTARGMRIANGMLWDPNFFNIFWDNQVFMFTFHSQLTALHPFSSVWWQWILNIRPFLFVSNLYEPYSDLRAVLAVFGNPVIWWGGLLAMVVMAVRVFTHHDGKALFILIGYLVHLLPWIFITRVLFIYHYFPSSLFIIMALAHMFSTIRDRRKSFSRTAVICGFTTLAGAVFVLFYPMLSGMYVPTWYFSNFIRWLPTWPF